MGNGSLFVLRNDNDDDEDDDDEHYLSRKWATAKGRWNAKEDASTGSKHEKT